MYTTCLFCNGRLGRNEALEHFQVGRRLAYDEAKGRLWVVCAKCERWNLTPLETRWEAIEEAERAFRAAKLRLATDNIGLAQLSEGLELVRVGAPPRLELAGWRYGDQFGRRRRRHLAVAALTVVGGSAQLVGQLFGAAFLGAGAALAYNAVSLWQIRRHKTATHLIVRDDTGSPLTLTKNDALSAALVTVPKTGGWYLKVQHVRPAPGTQSSGRLPQPTWLPYSTRLTGVAAQRALASMLPANNSAGGSRRTVRDAVDEISSASSIDSLIVKAASVRQYTNAIPGENLVGGLDPRLRLALEMVLHEDDERRAMEGELAELEERWREAEEIASIADSLLVPDHIEEKLSALKRSGGAQRM